MRQVRVWREDLVNLSMEQEGTASPPTVGDIHNSTGNSRPLVTGEEVGIVLVVLILWIGAIVLFFNRWGKIRMLEPYQPKFCEHHNPNCPMADVPPLANNYPVTANQRTFSKFNLASEAGGSPHFSKCNYHGVTSAVLAATEPLLNGQTSSMSINGGGGGGPSGRSMSITMMGGLSPRLGIRPHSRQRQNSVFVTSPNFPGVSLFGEPSSGLSKNSSRKTKSAVDLSSLVLSGEFMDNVRRNSKNSITNL